jgi:hypothetical protein
MKADEMIKVMRDAGFVVEVYPGVGKAFATKRDVFLEAKNTKSLYNKFKNHTTR